MIHLLFCVIFNNTYIVQKFINITIHQRYFKERLLINYHEKLPCTEFTIFEKTNSISTFSSVMVNLL